jgi:hypothetical protein
VRHLDRLDVVLELGMHVDQQTLELPQIDDYLRQ